MRLEPLPSTPKIWLNVFDVEIERIGELVHIDAHISIGARFQISDWHFIVSDVGEFRLIENLISEFIRLRRAEGVHTDAGKAEAIAVVGWDSGCRTAERSSDRTGHGRALADRRKCLDRSLR